MKFPEIFLRDLQQAFEYWRDSELDRLSVQAAAEGANARQIALQTEVVGNMSIEKWTVQLLLPAVNKALSERRTRETLKAFNEQSETEKQEKSG